ncbi:MAG: hypothetical protein ACOYYS_02055 [Chloroflexota bacterium]
MKRQTLFLAVFLVLIAALCYLPLAHRFGFYNDDWYLLYAWDSVQGSQGAAGLAEVFAVDRPLRGLVVGGLFELFDVNPLLYSLSAFGLRVAGAYGVWWLLRRVTGRQLTAYLAALLFVVYPGFLDQPNAIDYQSHQIAFALEIFSLVLSLRAVDVRSGWLKVASIVVASLLALFSFLLMEYYIGLEGLRFLLLLAVCSAAGKPGWQPRLQRTLLYMALPLIVSLGFFYWRVFIFQGERLATDITAIAAGLAGSPALRGVWMLIRLFQDVFNVSFVAWAEPLYRLAFSLRLKHFLLAGGIGVAAAGLVLFLARFAFRVAENERGSDAQADSTKLAGHLAPWPLTLLGVLAIVFALLPIHFGDRHVLFESFGRFTLTASVGLAFVLAGVLAALGPRLRTGLVVALVGLAVMAHSANAIRHAENWDVVRNFWWQVSWRAPQIEPGTLLIASYAGQGIAEDYFVWGPANLIYYPDLQSGLPVTLTLTAATLNQADVLNTLRGASEERIRRGMSGEKDFGSVLVLSLPAADSCVHVLDGNSPELSAQDRPEIMLLAGLSQIERIRLDDEPRLPPEAIFGQAPGVGWCYYYQKASLARQQGDWDEVVRLGDEALAQDLRPYDWIEWLPFAQAYAYTGRSQSLHDTAAVLRTDLFYRHEACRLARSDAYGYAQAYPEGHEQLVEMLCRP